MASKNPRSVVPPVSLAEYHYDLPDSRIATHPLPERDRSRLLVTDVAAGAISHHIFSDLPSLIPADAMLVVNSTRVVRARIIMQRRTGGRVEIFLLEPVEPSNDPARALAAHGESIWACMVGGARKLAKEGELRGSFAAPDGGEIELRASLAGEHPEGFLIRFRWSPEALSFAELLEAAGKIPLPPYIKRDATDEDAGTYQTVYAREEGAVAAPTAGLHFTPAVLDALERRGVKIERVALHVGAGTFKQVKGEVAEHEMHQERIVVARDTLAALIDHAERRERSMSSPFVLVGTTSLRTMESLYWLGARLIAGEKVEGELLVEQWDPYRLTDELGEARLPSPADALRAVERWRASHGMGAVGGRTGIMIVPGYRFMICDALITNFHQPGSTLILLVGALLGHDLWRRVYRTALEEGYRFLSYGDACLFVRERFGEG
jgi:S-adenosylmethionine:tRNA ribosyltransferase-isomerase